MDQQDAPPPVYADGVQIGLSPFTAQLTFTMAVSGIGTQLPANVANVRMSLEHAKVLSMLLKRQLKAFEDQMQSPIHIHPQVFQQLGLSMNEDW